MSDPRDIATRGSASPSYREQLTLELAIVSEPKSAKIIALVEEMRRDNWLMADRLDHVAEAMSTPADLRAVLDAIGDSEVDRAPGARARTRGNDDPERKDLAICPP